MTLREKTICQTDESSNVKLWYSKTLFTLLSFVYAGTFRLCAIDHGYNSEHPAKKEKNEGEESVALIVYTVYVHTHCTKKECQSRSGFFVSFLKNISFHVWNENIAIVCHDVYGIKLRAKK